MNAHLQDLFQQAETGGLEEMRIFCQYYLDSILRDVDYMSQVKWEMRKTYWPASESYHFDIMSCGISVLYGEVSATQKLDDVVYVAAQSLETDIIARAPRERGICLGVTCKGGLRFRLSTIFFGGREEVESDRDLDFGRDRGVLVSFLREYFDFLRIDRQAA